MIKKFATQTFKDKNRRYFRRFLSYLLTHGKICTKSKETVPKKIYQIFGILLTGAEKKSINKL